MLPLVIRPNLEHILHGAPKPTTALPCKPLYPNMTFSTSSAMPHTQFPRMHTSGEPAMPEFYSQDPTVHEFGVPSGSSLDSAFDEVNPFEKLTQCQPGADTQFDR